MRNLGRGRAGRRTLAVVATALVLGTALVANGPRALTAHAATTSSTNSVGFGVAQAIDPTSGNIYVAAMGPSHSLYFYWDLAGTWHGPVAIAGAGSTYSAPTITVDANHNVVVAAQGPGNRLYFYWNVSGTWYGPLQVGATGVAASHPSIVLDKAGDLNLAVQSPGKTLSFFWNVNAAWYGPYGLGAAGSALSAPSLSAEPGNNVVYVTTQGPSNSLIVYRSNAGTWAVSQSGAQTNFAAPSASGNRFYVQGAGNDLDNWFWDTGEQRIGGDWPVGPGGVTLSAPTGSGSNAAAAVGPSNSLLFYWETAAWNGPLGLGGAGAAWSVPSMASKLNDGQSPSIAIQGPNNSLLFYWNLKGTWYGPLGIGAAGTTFASPN